MRELWFADGYLLTDEKIRDIAFDAAIYTTPGKRGSDTEIAQRNGSVWRQKMYTAGSFTLNMWVYSYYGQKEAQNIYRDLLRVIQRQDGLVKYERVWEDGSHHYQCYGELVQSVTPVPSSSRGFRMGFEITLPNAFWEGALPVTHTTSASATVPQSLVLTGHADATAPMDDFVYTVTGPITNPSVSTVRAGAAIAERWTYSGTVTAGQTLVVDSSTYGITGTGGIVVDLSKMDYTGSRYLTVQPVRPNDTNGGPVVQLTGTNTAATTRLSVTGRSKVLS